MYGLPLLEAAGTAHTCNFESPLFPRCLPPGHRAPGTQPSRAVFRLVPRVPVCTVRDSVGVVRQCMFAKALTSGRVDIVYVICGSAKEEC